MNQEDLYELDKLIKNMEELQDSNNKEGSLNIPKTIYNLSKFIEVMDKVLLDLKLSLRRFEGFHESD